MRKNLIAGFLVAAGLAMIGAAAWTSAGIHRPGPSDSALVTSQPRTQPRDEHDSGLQPGADSLPGVTSRTVALSGGASAAISIPKIGVRNAPIFQRGVDTQGNMLISPGYTVTHFSFSAALGDGNAVLYGHDDIEGSIFAHLQDLRPGDELEVATPVGAQTYRVTERRIVAPTAIDILNPTGDVRLTIFTCWPTWVDDQRVVITAKPVE